MADRADLVALAATETEPIHRGIDFDGQKPLRERLARPKAVDRDEAHAGDGLPCHAAPGLLVMAPLDADAGTRRQAGDARRTQALDTEADADD